MSIYQIPSINNNLDLNNIKLQFSETQPNNIICKTLSIYLNKVKGIIGQYSIEWDQFKRITNNYEYIHTPAPNSKNSISKLKPLSRAFYKLIEICNIFNLLDIYSPHFNSFHLAEGPGGFIEAVSHLRNNESDIYHAISLIDDENDNIPGWKKSSLFLRKNMNVVIEKGVEGKGNLYNPDNFKYFTRIFKNKLDFITADGGFDFSVDFNNQETMAFRLLFTEVMYALMLQKQGGHFVIKMFDTFIKSSVDILYLLSCFYQKIFIFKPNTSRSANSEKYIVCKNFKYKNTDHLFNKLHTILKVLDHETIQKSFIYSIINIDYPYKFKQTIEEVSTILASQQIDNILTTIRFIENKERRGEKIQQIKDNNIQKCIQWCVKNKIPHYKISQSTNIFLTNRKISPSANH